MSSALWTDEQQRRAEEEGWQLGLTVDSGRPLSTAYLEIFQHGPRFNSRSAAVHHVLMQAQARSKFHTDALAARVASRIPKGKR